MLRLVEPYFASAGKADFSDRAPSGFLHRRTFHALRRKRQYLGLQVVAHEIQFVPVALAIGMYRQFCWRQREDQPSMTRVHGRESEDIPHEGAIRLYGFAVYDHMRTEDHAESLSGMRKPWVALRSLTLKHRRDLVPSERGSTPLRNDN